MEQNRSHLGRQDLWAAKLWACSEVDLKAVGTARLRLRVPLQKKASTF